MNKIYVLTFDPHKSDPTGLHNYIKISPYILDWWHYLGSTYLLKTTYTVETIQTEITKNWPDHSFLLMEVNALSFSGWLVKDAWDWIRSRR